MCGDTVLQQVFILHRRKRWYVCRVRSALPSSHGSRSRATSSHNGHDSAALRPSFSPLPRHPAIAEEVHEEVASIDTRSLYDHSHSREQDGSRGHTPGHDLDRDHDRDRGRQRFSTSQSLSRSADETRSMESCTNASQAPTGCEASVSSISLGEAAREMQRALSLHTAESGASGQLAPLPGERVHNLPHYALVDTRAAVSGHRRSHNGYLGLQPQSLPQYIPADTHSGNSGHRVSYSVLRTSAAHPDLPRRPASEQLRRGAGAHVRSASRQRGGVKTGSFDSQDSLIERAIARGQRTRQHSNLVTRAEQRRPSALGHAAGGSGEYVHGYFEHDGTRASYNFSRGNGATANF